MPGPIAYQEPEARGAFAQIHHKVADLLHSPRAVRIRGDPGDVHVTAAVWVPKTPSTSCNQAIFVDRADSESLSSDVVLLDRFG